MIRRILITGGFGYLGGRIAQALSACPDTHIILGSRLPQTQPAWLPQARVVPIEWDSLAGLEKICGAVDVVIHAAGMNAQDCAADPIAALEFNGLATTRLISAARRAGVKRFIYLSTAHVYASPLAGIINEESCPRNLHPYSTSHLAGENAVFGANLEGKIESVVLRLSNVFGAPVTKEANCWMLLVNDLCRQAVQTGKMVLRSSGVDQRNFIPMTDACRAIGHIALRDFGVNEPKLLNIGAGMSRSVLEMARLIQRRCKLVLGYEPELQTPNSDANPHPQILDYRTVRLMETGFRAIVDNSTEIDELLFFCREAFSQPQSK